MKPSIQAAIAARLRPRLKRLGLSLDNTLEECRRLAYARLGPAFEDANGELLPVNEWPKESRQTALQLLSLKQQGLMGVLKYLKHAGVYGQPEPPANAHRKQRDGRAARASDQNATYSSCARMAP